MKRATLFIDLGSQPSRAAYWLTMLLKSDVEVKVVRLDKGETRSPEYLAVHPLGKVPAMTINGNPLIESNAILLYLCEAAGAEGQKFFPRPTNEQNTLRWAKLQSYLHYHHEFRNGVASWFVVNVMSPVLGRPTSEAASKSADKKLKTTLDLFESYWLQGEGGFIGGESHPTIADFQAYNEVIQVTPFVQEDLTVNRPRLKRWMEQLKKTPHHDEMQKGWLKVVEAIKSKRSKL